MDSDKRKLKFILLVIVGITIAVLAFIYAHSQLSGSSDLPTNDEQYATFPDSGTRETSNNVTVEDVSQVPTSPTPALDPTPTQPQNNSNQDEIDWRDEIVYSEPGISEASVTQPAMAIDMESEINALYAAAEELASYKPSYPDGWPLPTSTPPESMSFSEYSTLFKPAKLVQTGPIDCGNVDVPSSAAAREKFGSDIGENSSFMCMGEAVASDCSLAKTVIIDGGISQSIILAKRTDGVCGIGLSYDNKNINLCSIEDVMNAMTGENNNFSEWKNIFKDRPGDTFAQLYIGSSEGITKAAAAGKLDCKMLEL